jgi:quinohemoprotein amine dehydrogenase
VIEELQRDDDSILLRVRADAGIAPVRRAIGIDGRDSEVAFTLFRQVDRIAVEPAYAVARVGGDGGSQPIVEAMFDAVGFSNGADGEPGTADDLRIGVLPAQWSVAPFDAQAEADEDVRFAGQMDHSSGVFTPAAAGPNPERKYQTNNAGNLRVQATLATTDTLLEAEGQLIVTVQRWNNPPIR